MANLKEGLNAFLTASAITALVYHQDLPQNPTYPATVFDVIDQIPVGRNHDNGVLPMREARVQIEVFAETLAAAESAAEQYFELLGNYDGSLGVAGLTNVSIRWDADNPDPLAPLDTVILRTLFARSMDFIVLY